MKHKTYKFIFLIGFLVVLSFRIWQPCHAQQKLLIDYPVIASTSISYGTSLPDLIKYVYLFSLGIVGVVALLMMVIGAAQYVMSAGNASKASDAKDRIYSAILGIIILVASVLILRTINPDLVNIGFVLPTITPPQGVGGTTTNSRCVCCHYTGPTHCNPVQTGTAITHPQYWPTICRIIVPNQTEYDQCSRACFWNANGCNGSSSNSCWSQVVLCP